jgi:hypothetical protein
VEQSIALLHWFRRLRIRWEIRDDIHEAFLSLACAIICWRRLTNLAPRTEDGDRAAVRRIRLAYLIRARKSGGDVRARCSGRRDTS